MPNWANSRSLEIVSRRNNKSPAPRQFLVFVVPSSHVASPLLKVLHDDRNFDLAIRFYEAPGVNQHLCECAEFVMTGGLSKFHAAANFFKKSGLQNCYDGYLFLDGDLEFDADQLSNFLSFVHAAGLDLSQPSVTRDSYCYWKMAYHQPGFVFRETSFVEVMAPYLSRAALSRTLETFTRSISTYGLDLVWPHLIDSSAIGVVDAFQVRHQEHVDHAAGRFYRYLKSINVDLDEEERTVLAEYGVNPVTAHSLRGYFWKKPFLFSGRIPTLVSVPLGAPEVKSDQHIWIDTAMCFARMNPRREERTEARLAAAIAPYLIGSRIAVRRSEDDV